MDAESHPWKLILLGFGFATLAVWLAGASGFPQGGLLVVGFSSIAAIPFLIHLFDYEATRPKLWESDSAAEGGSIISRNILAITVLGMLFVGLMAGYVFWQLYLPQNQVSSLFDAQIQEVSAINPSVGMAVSQVMSTDPVAEFQLIFFHNLQVTGIVLFFSAIYGAGAIAILAWNASVIATFLVAVAKNFAGTANPQTAALVAGLGTGFLGILPHSIFELSAYLTMAVAGSLLSLSLVRSAKSDQEFFMLLFDAAKLIGISIALLAIAAVIESNAFAG
jgi:uncharacterized membrane protein SpoIIM required for sporulation